MREWSQVPTTGLAIMESHIYKYIILRLDQTRLFALCFSKKATSFSIWWVEETKKIRVSTKSHIVGSLDQPLKTDGIKWECSFFFFLQNMRLCYAYLTTPNSLSGLILATKKISVPTLVSPTSYQTQINSFPQFVINKKLIFHIFTFR